jgi:N-acetylglutamate synthase-like GNAT family acetyltransferase
MAKLNQRFVRIEVRNSYELIKVTDPSHWRAYHDIRRKVLWENRGKQGYDDKHVDETLPNHHPLLLLLNNNPIGTTRLDDLKNGYGIVRLVAICRDIQRNGHGRHLSFLVEEFARNLGIKTLYVNAAPEALGFYKKTGWELYEWDAEELKGIAEDCWQMRKILD